MGAIEGTRAVIQDGSAPNLRRLGEEVAAAHKALGKMEARMLAAIQAAKDHLSLWIDRALLQENFEALQRRMETKPSR